MEETENKLTARMIILKMKARGMTNKAIARRCLTTEQSIYRWLSGGIPGEIYLDALHRAEIETRQNDMSAIDGK